MKKIFKLFLITLCGITLLTGCGCNKKEKVNNSKKETFNSEVKDVKVNELDVVDFVVLFEDNISDVYFEVQNNTDKVVSYEKIICSMYDKNGNIIYSFDEELGTLEPLDELEVSYKVDIDLTKVASVEYALQ